MKSFREFLNEATEAGNKIVQFKRKLAGATDPAEKARLQKAIDDAMKASQNKAAGLGNQKFTAPNVPPKAGSSTRAGGSNQVIPGQPNSTTKPGTNVPPKAGSGTRAGGSNQVIPGQPNSTRKGVGAVRKGFGAYSAYSAVDAASRGDYGGAATDTILAAQGSRRLSSAVPGVQKQVLQKLAPKLAPKLARFVPGLQQAYGITKGSLAAASGDTTGAVLGYGSAIPGPVGYGFVAADIGRDVAKTYAPKQYKAFKDTTGITRLQQSKELENKAIQSGQGMTGIARAQQTMYTRDARNASTAYGTKKGSALTGLGGPAKVDTKAGTLTTKGKTVKLASTQLVRDPKTGQQRVGDLAYKGGKAVYLARPSIASRDTSLAGGIGRALNLGRFSKEAEQKAAKTEYRTALKSTQAYTKGLGISNKSATTQKLPGYGSAPTPKPTPTPKPKPDVVSRRMNNPFGMG